MNSPVAMGNREVTFNMYVERNSVSIHDVYIPIPTYSAMQQYTQLSITMRCLSQKCLTCIRCKDKNMKSHNASNASCSIPVPLYAPSWVSQHTVVT
ncbi:hypothetical protein VTN49DRAFT_7010 [Thermomyces lanuginosus]|uniref:uncharacterized protein n=1 Tax=Thermomyces lanuginosus TaxID=5541 RepID=UPI0037442DDA